MKAWIARVALAAIGVSASAGLSAQATASVPAAPPYLTPIASTSASLVPPGYVIGPEDVLQVTFWREKDMSSEVIVRPDGKISLPLVNDVYAEGLTPEQLRARITEEARRYVDDPTASVMVKAINSRKVFITGDVEKPGTYPLAGLSTVLQLIAVAGGLKEYTSGEEIRIVRRVNGRETAIPFNYKRVAEGKRLDTNIALKPGDTIVVR
jgi:polysaccharide biosynthesis/export protein